MLKDLYIPHRVRAGITPLGQPWSPAEIWGADFETVHGVPYTFQISDPDSASIDYLESPGMGFDLLLDHARERAAKRVRCYFWSLSYDLPCLLYDQLECFRLRQFESQFVYKDVRGWISVACSRSWFGHVRWGKYRIQIIDACQFYRCSLEKASREILKIRKHPHPRGLGTRKLKGPRFERYAVRDATNTRKLALLIEAQHHKHDIAPSVSASQFAAKVFRRKFLRRTIPYIPRAVETAAVLSYHGGANWITADAPKLYRNVQEYDISSAYPEAFCQLPDFSAPLGRWMEMDGTPPGKGKHWNFEGAHGFVRIRFSGQCQYHGLRAHDFGVLNRGTVWVTTYEAASCWDCLENPQVLKAYLWLGGGRSPFEAYMWHFYRQKERAAKGSVDAEFAKICLNGISGKLVQNVEDDKGTFTVGGLWNPAAASLVTGFTRARMHGLMHRYSGLHCATDAFITRKRARIGKGMGSLGLSCKGDLLLLRNKLYVFFKSGTDEILKWGAHGFWGSKKDLLRLWRKRTVKYKVKHIYRVREAFRQKKVPLAESKVTRKLAICWDAYQEETSHGG